MITLGEDMAYPVKVCNGYIEGLTKRELFAAMAMQGILSDSNAVGTITTIAEAAVKSADALISELNKEVQS